MTEKMTEAVIGIPIRNQYQSIEVFHNHVVL